VQWLQRRGSVLAKEYFAGCGRLSGALCRRGIACKPYERFRQGVYDRSEDLDCEDVLAAEVSSCASGEVSFAHFGIECTSWSALGRMNNGTRRLATPLGDGTVPSELHANRQLENTLRLIRSLESAGAIWTLENPAGSYLFKAPSVIELLQREGMYKVTFDMCEFGLAPPDQPEKRIRKSTTVISNFPCSRLERRCAGKHEHLCCLGMVRHEGRSQARSKLAGMYPHEFCDELAMCVSAELKRRMSRQSPEAAAPPLQ
jgi:hypothetical protein